MRITRESLHTIARETAEKYSRRSRELVCIYLTGSLLTDSPLLGGTTDIDLVFVHASTPPFPREVVRVSDEIHLDIAHYPQSVFHQPRRLRHDPWIGSHLCLNALPLYEIQHWFEFTQAGVGAQFDQADNVINRAQNLAKTARQSWFDLQSQPAGGAAEKNQQYLLALENAANSISVITGAPLTERRFIQQFPQRAAEIGRPGLAAGLVDLFAVEGYSSTALAGWMEPWRECLQEASQLENVPPRLAPPRFYYYERAAAALNEEDPAAALWLILRTWTRAIQLVDPGSDHHKTWEQACVEFKLDETHFESRLNLLDSYLDAVEDTLDDWGRKYGV